MFVAYAPRAPALGPCPHPAPLEESATLAAVPCPDVSSVNLHLPRALREDGRVSAAQLEAVALAVRATTGPLLPDGRRAGFLLGDGTGVGKSRTLATFIRALAGRYGGRLRAVWVSLNQSLRDAATNEWRILHQNDDDDVENFPHRPSLRRLVGAGAGWTFTTYSALQRDASFQTLRAWLEAGERAGEEIVLLLDECHRAKRVDVATSVTAQRVAELQRLFPRAHVLYSSATAASSPRHLVYMSRLGMYGEGTPFASGAAFTAALLEAGVTAMELLASDLKRMGRLVARTISFRDADFRLETVRLGAEARRVYDACAEHWSDHLLQEELPGMWMGHQRFFRGLLTGLKVPACVAMVRRALAAGRAAVVSLRAVGSGRSTTTAAADHAGGGRGGAPTSLRGQLLAAHARRGTEPPPGLLALLPANPLDQLLEAFSDRSDEITGRRHAVHVNGRPRSNQEVRDAFQSGELDVVVISEAGSSGISLHAEPRDARRRLHIILEVPWSSESFLQQCGRTHRTNQASAPEFVLLATDLPGESRFVASIQKKLMHMGALTRGDRNASHAPAVEALADHDFLTRPGKQVLSRLAQDMIADVGMQLLEREDRKRLGADMVRMLGYNFGSPRTRHQARQMLWSSRNRRRPRINSSGDTVEAWNRCLVDQITGIVGELLGPRAEQVRCAQAALLDFFSHGTSTVSGLFHIRCNDIPDGYVAVVNGPGSALRMLPFDRSSKTTRPVVHVPSDADARTWLLGRDALRVQTQALLREWAPVLMLHAYAEAHGTVVRYARAASGGGGGGGRQILRRSYPLWTSGTHSRFPPAARACFRTTLMLLARHAVPREVAEQILAFASNWDDMPDSRAALEAFMRVGVSTGEVQKLTVTRCLNRLLGFPVRDQRNVFNAFKRRLADLREVTAAAGAADPPPQTWVSDPDRCLYRIGRREVLASARDGTRHLFPVEIVTVEKTTVRHRFAWNEIQFPENTFCVERFSHRVSRRPRLVVTDRRTSMVTEWRPRSRVVPNQTFHADEREHVLRDLEPVTDLEAFAESWNLEYEALCRKDQSRTPALRHLLCGPVMDIWALVLRSHELARRDEATTRQPVRVVRCIAEEGRAAVGIEVSDLDLFYEATRAE